MQIHKIEIKAALNKAYLKEKVNRADIDLFKKHLADLLNKINDKADEEHLKSLIADFLKFTWYKDAFQINPVGKTDLVIHTSKSPADPVGMILEVKSLANKAEMISGQKLIVTDENNDPFKYKVLSILLISKIKLTNSFTNYII